MTTSEQDEMYKLCPLSTELHVQAPEAAAAAAVVLAAAELGGKCSGYPPIRAGVDPSPLTPRVPVHAENMYLYIYLYM